MSSQNLCQTLHAAHVYFLQDKLINLWEYSKNNVRWKLQSEVKSYENYRGNYWCRFCEIGLNHAKFNLKVKLLSKSIMVMPYFLYSNLVTLFLLHFLRYFMEVCNVQNLDLCFTFVKRKCFGGTQILIVLYRLMRDLNRIWGNSLSFM